MVKIKYEEYHNDYIRYDRDKCFENLDELEDWIFDQMKRDYSDKEKGWLAMYFPKEPSRIQFTPDNTRPSYWIHLIEDGRGILFTDGKYTSGRKHMSEEIREWCRKCHKRQYAPKFNFVE